ncbi:alpha,alpha-trehalose-phosphate synthase (UDP-forming) [Hyphomicrobium sp.]|uniref:alpha,alpha-trehalose-phosphate synthase (UDP-forming) n=1 Tax=Hyphomicrobium sp. TaxID=82 RepID=UPI002E31B2B6|nr:trehalose-6-phosphate synthase [Hyphomicrobium sp.]HEX2839756.1 trehalose-6-phosphate synthase [Hyphomicrobium sp.]
MGRIIVVSNRVMDLRKAAQAGGVAVAIADLLRTRPGLWFGWNGKVVGNGDIPDQADLKHVKRAGRSGLATLPLTEEEHRDYYLGYSNSVLWPVFHNRLDLAQFEADFYAGYIRVNQRFAHALRAHIQPDDHIWVHDYHLIPLAAELRRSGVTNPIGFYLHIPVPPSQTFLAIPEHRELARALAAYDLIGLQTRADVANLIQFFEDSVSGRILQDGRVGVFDQRLRIERFPVGIDADDFVKASPVAPLVQSNDDGAQRIVGVDRLDYSKGLPQKFRAFGRFLEKYPQYRRNVVLSQIAPPTRESVEAYTDIRQTLEALSGKINGMFGELDWVPIHYIYRSTPRDRLRDIYRSSGIGFFTPLRDGMNLVSKEYVASQDPNDPGVPILSRFAGAAEQLVDALIVNPYNVEEMADAIKTALEMEKPERIERYTRLMEVIRGYDTATWSRSFLARLESAAEERARVVAPLTPLRSPCPKAAHAATPSLSSRLNKFSGKVSRAANSLSRSE